MGKDLRKKPITHLLAPLGKGHIHAFVAKHPTAYRGLKGSGLFEQRIDKPSSDRGLHHMQQIQNKLLRLRGIVTYVC